eukprot:37331-Pyramimonas_sp.AAC.1
MKNPDAGSEALKRALGLLEAKFGSNHPSVSACLNNLAGCYMQQNLPNKALQMLERDLAATEK